MTQDNTKPADAERERLIEHLMRYGLAVEWQASTGSNDTELRHYVEPIADFILNDRKKHQPPVPTVDAGELDIANWTALRMRKMHRPITEGKFIEGLTPHQYMTKEIAALVVATRQAGIQEGEQRGLQKLSDKLDELHQGSPGAGWVSYPEISEWIDERLATQPKDKEQDHNAR